MSGYARFQAWPFAPTPLGERIRRLDWSATPLNRSWPPELRAQVDMVLEAAPAQLLLWGASLTVVAYSPGYAGLPGGWPDVLGRRFAEVAPELARALGPQIDAARAGGRAWTDRGWHDPGGGGATFDYGVSPVRGSGGEVAGVVLTALEAGNRAQHGGDGEAVETRLRRLFHAAPAAIAIHEGREHVFLFANAAYDAAIGRRPVIGARLAATLPELARQGAVDFYDRVLATGQPVHVPEVCFEVPADAGDTPGFRWLRQTLQPWFDPAGRPIGVISAAFDVTELIEARHDAETASRAKDQFLAAMSHELRTPLNAIIGFAELIRDQAFGPGSERYPEYAQDVCTSARHLLGIVQDILSVADGRSAQVDLDETPVDLALLVDECIGVFAADAGRTSVTVTNALPADAHVVLGDRQRLRQVVAHLLSNAVKHAPPGSTVDVDARVDGRGLQLRVRDRGPGMSDAQRQRVFEPFTQLRGNRLAPSDGIGLGLTMVEQLVDLHGGMVWLDTAPGAGTTAVVALPASRVVRCERLSTGT